MTVVRRLAVAGWGFVAIGLVGVAACGRFEFAESQPSDAVANAPPLTDDAGAEAATGDPSDGGKLVKLTVTLEGNNGATVVPQGAEVSITSEPTGITCKGTCTAQTKWFPRGSIVKLAKGPGVYRFSGGCTGDACEVTMNTDQNVKVRGSAFNYMFLTSSTMNGEIAKPAVAGVSLAVSAIDAANAICNAHAINANIPGKYIAWLSPVAFQSVSDKQGLKDLSKRLGVASGWIRPDGKPVFHDAAAIAWSTETPRYFFYMPLLDENGQEPRDMEFWTGVTSHDNVKEAGTCSGFSSTIGKGVVGDATVADQFWDSSKLPRCAELKHLMCIGIDLKTPAKVPEPSEPVRRAFVSADTIAPSKMLDPTVGADALCKKEAQLVYGSSRTFRALFAPGPSATPVGHIDSKRDAPWVRPDNVQLAASADNFFAGKRHALSFTASKLNLGEQQVVTGSSTSYPSEWAVSSGTASTCTDATKGTGWSSSSSNVVYMRGVSTRSREKMGFSDNAKCDSLQHVYCLED
jgi:hypothetical protein